MGRLNPRVKVGVLISGRGSNMLALVDACAAADFPAEIALVLSDKPAAGGLALAAERGLAAAAIDRKAYRSKTEFESALDDALRSAGFNAAKGNWPADWRRFRGTLNGPQSPGPTEAPIRIVIGSRAR